MRRGSLFPSAPPRLTPLFLTFRLQPRRGGQAVQADAWPQAEDQADDGRRRPGQQCECDVRPGQAARGWSQRATTRVTAFPRRAKAPLCAHPALPPHLQVMVAEALDIEREIYFAILMDRESLGPVMVGSPEGGVDIEEVAEASPEKIFKARRPRLGSSALESSPMRMPSPHTFFFPYRSPLTLSRAWRKRPSTAWRATSALRASWPSRCAPHPSARQRCAGREPH